MDKYSLLRDAVQRKLNVSGRYDGLYREFCPHVLGHSHGYALVLTLQYAGASRSGLDPDNSENNWRCFRVFDFRDLESHRAPWRTASNWSPDQRCVRDIDVSVDGHSQ